MTNRQPSREAELVRMHVNSRLFVGVYLFLVVSVLLIIRVIMRRTGTTVGESAVLSVVLAIWGGGWARWRLGASLNRAVVTAGISAAGGIVTVIILHAVSAHS
jgi:hypothetical protein